MGERNTAVGRQIVGFLRAELEVGSPIPQYASHEKKSVSVFTWSQSVPRKSSGKPLLNIVYLANIGKGHHKFESA